MCTIINFLYSYTKLEIQIKFSLKNYSYLKRATKTLRSKTLARHTKKIVKINAIVP